jgi:chromosome segregation ATPase
MANEQDTKFNGLKQRLDSLRQQRARDEGALNQLMTRLKSEFSCTTVEAARKKYATLKKEVDALQVEINDGLAELETVVSAMES